MNQKKIIYFILLALCFLHINPAGALSNTFLSEETLKGTWYGKTSTAGRIGNTTLGNLDASRTTYGLKGNANVDIGVKWKQYLGGVAISSSLVYAGTDINGDGRDDVFYVKGGKGYLVDLATGLTVWESKVIGINKILGVEGVFGNTKKKQIVFVFGDNPFYVGILDGRTGEMVTNSKIWGTLSETWTYSPSFIREKQTDGSAIYTIYVWRSPTVGIRIYGENKLVKVQPLYETRYKNASGNIGNTSTEDNGGLISKITLGGKNYLLTSDYGQAYIMDPSSKYPLSAGGDFSMNNYHTYSISPGRSHGAYNSAYDLNQDGNDEYIIWNNEIPQYYQKTKMWVGGLTSSGQIRNFWGISWPLGTTINKVLPIKNYADANQPYVAVKINGSTKYQFYQAFGSGSNGYTQNVDLGSNGANTIQSFNEKLGFEYDTATYGDIVGIFDNGAGIDYVVTYDTKYYLFKFTGSHTFDSPATIQITGGLLNPGDKYVSNYGFKYGLFEVRGGDINANGIREFLVYESYSFKHYEINNNIKTLVSDIIYYPSETPTGTTIQSREYTFDGKELWAYSYQSSDNTIKITKTNRAGGQTNYTHLTQNYPIYSAGITSPLSIFKSNDKNYLHMGNAIYDGTSATPNSSPTKKANLDNDAYIVDVDGTGSMNVITGPNVYDLGASFGLTRTSGFVDGAYGWNGDYDGDGVLDRGGVYKDTDNFYKYYPISGKSNTQIYPPISTNNTSCGPTYFTSVRLTSSDKDDLISGSSWCGHQSRILDPSGNFKYTLNHLHTIQLFDIDGDGVKDAFGQSNNYGAYILQATKLTPSGPTTIFSTTIYDTIMGDFGGPATSVNRTQSGELNFAVKGLRGEIIGLNGVGQILFRSHYYDGKRYPGGEDAIFQDGGVPLDFADVLVADITGNGKNYIVAGGMDGWIYIIDINTGNIVYKYEIGVSITNMAIGDADNDGLLNILVSAQDGFVYRIISSSTPAPAWVKDGGEYDADIELLGEDNKASVNFAPVIGAEGYQVQLYNKTKKSPVFDWIDVGPQTIACIRSSTSSGTGCINANRVFNLTNKSVYEWRVQSYNNQVSSPIAKSDGFVVTTENGYFLSEDDEEVEADYIETTTTSSGLTWYTDKNLNVFGDSLGVIVNSDNTPVIGSGEIDIGMTNNEYKIVLDKERALQGTGNVLRQINSTYNCNNIKVNGLSKGDGVYKINAIGGDPFEVYCDMTTDGGGWTLIAVSNPSLNTFGNNKNRASPFADFYTNQKDTILDPIISDDEVGVVLKDERRMGLISNSSQTLIKGIKGTNAFYVHEGKLNLGNREVNAKERLSGMYYWDAKFGGFIVNNTWRTSMQTWGNNCGWIEYLPDLKINDLITAQKQNVNYQWCLGTPPVNPIGIGWFIR